MDRKYTIRILRRLEGLLLTNREYMEQDDICDLVDEIDKLEEELRTNES